MSKRKKLRGFGYRRADAFVKLDHGLLRSEAWQRLSPDASKVLLDIWTRHQGVNNGEISYAQSEAHACLCRAHGRTVSRRRAIAALHDIQQKGFAIVTRASSFTMKSKMARTWRLTAERAGDEPPSREFKHWKIQNTGTDTVPHKHRDGACAVSGYRYRHGHRHRVGACNGGSGPPDRNRDGATYNLPGGRSDGDRAEDGDVTVWRFTETAARNRVAELFFSEPGNRRRAPPLPKIVTVLMDENYCRPDARPWSVRDVKAMIAATRRERAKR